MTQPDTCRRFATISRLQIRHIHPVGQSMIERYIDDPPLAGTCARIKCLHDRLEGLHAGRDVADRNPDARRPVFRSVDCA